MAHIFSTITDQTNFNFEIILPAEFINLFEDNGEQKIKTFISLKMHQNLTEVKSRK